MTDQIIERVRAIVAKTPGPNAQALESCIRTLRSDKPASEKWLAITRAVSKADDPDGLLAILEALVR